MGDTEQWQEISELHEHFKKRIEELQADRDNLREGERAADKRIEELQAKHTALVDGLLNLPTYGGYLVPNDVYALLGDKDDE